MDGDVTIAVEWSTLNYKDGLAITGKAPVVRKCPHDPRHRPRRHGGKLRHPAWKPGDKVVLNGWGVGETHLGRLCAEGAGQGRLADAAAGRASTTREAMAIGTAGYTAMLAVMALERHGIDSGEGPIVVTGAAGGVGSSPIALLAQARLSR